MVRLFAIALVACSAPPARPPAQPLQAIPPPDAAVATLPDAALPRVIMASRPGDVIFAPHGGSIRVLAAAPDGSAVISCDDLGGVRLWPALDGSKEPRIVQLPEPRAFALGTRPQGFVVAVLDRVGGVYLAKLDSEGRMLSHVSLPIEPATQQIAMSELGLLAARDDQTLALIGDDGMTLQRLGTEPGQRLVAFAAVGRRVAAIMDEDSGGTRRRRLRAIQLEPKLAWGAWIESGVNNIGTQLALSPSGARVAFLTEVPAGVPKSLPAAVIAIDIATGKELTNQQATLVGGLVFPDEQHIAAGSTAGGVTWFDLDLTRSRRSPATSANSIRGALLAAGGGRAITARGGELVLASPTTNQFLGYELESPNLARPAPDGKILVGLHGALTLLDTNLDVERDVPVALGQDERVSDVRWAQGNDWLVIAGNFADSKVFSGVLDAATGKVTIAQRGLQIAQTLAYEPATRLVTYALDRPEVDQYDAAAHRLVRVARAPADREMRVIPVSPSLAHGAKLLATWMHNGANVAWVRDPAALDRNNPTLTIESFVAADPAGHVYGWKARPRQASLAIYGEGKQVGEVLLDSVATPWPDPTGTSFIAISARSVKRIALDGTLAWTQPIFGATEALWLTDGTIAIVSAGGIARLDAATGQVTAARCGWRFSLSPLTHPATPRVEPVCAQLAH